MVHKEYFIKQHQLCGENVRQVNSNHCDDRPAEESLCLMVIHNISLPPGQFGTGDIEAFFTGRLDWSLHPFYQEIKGVRVSAHLLIERTGQVIQFVPFHKRAWHAGVSCFEGKERCNDFSVGIELEGCDNQAFTDAQYQTLTAVTQVLMATYPDITAQRIVGHEQIAPGRKTDPGPCFDWGRYKAGL